MILRKDLFTAKVSNGSDPTIVLTSSQGNITLIGSSVPVSCRPGDNVASLTITPWMTRPGVVAVTVFDRGRGRGVADWVSYLLVVGFSGEIPRINLETVFECKGDRLGQAHKGAFIEVLINNDWYHSLDVVKYPIPKRSGHYVPDPNLLCRYLVGDASADEVKAATQKHTEEQMELEQLREQLKHSVPETVQFGLEHEIEMLEHTKQGLEDNVAFWRGVAFALWTVLRKFGFLFGWMFGSFARSLCDSPRFKTAQAHQSSWTYPTDAYDRKDGKDCVE